MFWILDFLATVLATFTKIGQILKMFALGSSQAQTKTNMTGFFSLAS
jgi:hypothetical protein